MKKKVQTKPKFQKLGINLALAFLILPFFWSSSFISEASLHKNPTPVQTSEIKSYGDQKLPEEYFKVRTPLKTKHTIYVSGRVTKNTKLICIRLFKHHRRYYYITTFVTPNKKGEFSVKINTAKNNKKIPSIQNKRGKIASAKDSSSTRPGYKAVPTIGPGTYHLVISKATTKKDAKIKGTNWQKGALGGKTNKWFAYKEVLMTVKKGHSNDPKVIKYPAVINNNNKVRKQFEKNPYATAKHPGSTERYLDKYMKDAGYIFKDPKTGVSQPMTDSQVQYIARLSKKITSGYKTDYQKMQAIYKYVAANIYYDFHALHAHKYQYSNPYLILYHLNSKKGSGPNYKNGKVGTTCQGYAAIVIAMARSIDIPARYAYGKHITLPKKTWADVPTSEIYERTHWWSEAYVNGRWIIVDPRPASYNKWRRSSFSASGTWINGGLGNYSAFAPSNEQISTSYIYTGIYPGSKEGRFASDLSETAQLKTFLETENNYTTNGSLLNDSYDADDRSTWGTMNNVDFRTDGYGHITKIQWPGYALCGNLNLNKYRQLKYLSVYNNSLSSIQLDGCTSLRSLKANNNQLTAFDSSDSPNLEIIHLLRNDLTSAKFMHENKAISVAIDQGHNVGSFSMTYKKISSKPLHINANDTIGYIYKGIYTRSGEEISSKRNYSFSPDSDEYVLKYEPIESNSVSLVSLKQH